MEKDWMISSILPRGLVSPLLACDAARRVPTRVRPAGAVWWFPWIRESLGWEPGPVRPAGHPFVLAHSPDRLLPDERERALNLGDPDRSARLYRQVLASVVSPRNRASYGAGLAYALLKQGARQDAIAAAMDVLPALEDGVTSVCCLDPLRLVRQAAASIPGAEEFCARFDVVERPGRSALAMP